LISTLWGVSGSLFLNRIWKGWSAGAVTAVVVKAIPCASISIASPVSAEALADAEADAEADADGDAAADSLGAAADSLGAAADPLGEVLGSGVADGAGA
jgi:hypothetical protein